MRWFNLNKNKVYKCVLLSWINPNKKIAILYFNDYYFSQICILVTKDYINTGAEINIKNIKMNNEEILYFEQVK